MTALALTLLIIFSHLIVNSEKKLSDTCKSENLVPTTCIYSGTLTVDIRHKLEYQDVILCDKSEYSTLHSGLFMWYEWKRFHRNMVQHPSSKHLPALNRRIITAIMAVMIHNIATMSYQKGKKKHM